MCRTHPFLQSFPFPAAKDIQNSQNIQGGSTDASVESSLLAGVDDESHASPCDVAAV